jgi:uncharacterized protein (TIGR00730 family)
MNRHYALTVYCSSSKLVAERFFDAATELGTAIAEKKWELVYGGNRVGMMEAVANAARAGGAKVIGITPQLLVDKGIADQACDELIVTQGMRDRKALLEQRGDAFVALPGGIGTFEEIFEILVGRQLGYHHKPIVLLNIAGYYDPLLELLDHGLREYFIRPGTRELIFVTEMVREGIDYLEKKLLKPA